MVVNTRVGEEMRDGRGDVAVLPGFLEVERELETVMPPSQSGRVRVGCVDVERCATCEHTVEGDVIVCVCHQATRLSGSGG